MFHCVFLQKENFIFFTWNLHHFSFFDDLQLTKAAINERRCLISSRFSLEINDFDNRTLYDFKIRSTVAQCFKMFVLFALHEVSRQESLERGAA